MEDAKEWSWGAFLLGPWFYLLHGMFREGLQLLLVHLIFGSLFLAVPIVGPLIAVPPFLLVAIFCGRNFLTHKLRFDAEGGEVVEGLTKVCPFCAETVKSAAVVCRYCGRDIPSQS